VIIVSLAMSSHGTRVSGSDGSDYLHRETVADHYKNSLTYKWRLKTLIIIHTISILLMLMRLSTFLFVSAGKRPPAFLQKLRLPKVQWWEYTWLLTALPAICGFLALAKNRIFLMQQYIIGIVIFGIVPLLAALYYHLDDLLEYIHVRKAAMLFHGLPVIVLWYIFLTLTVQLHMFSVYVAYLLLKAWKPKERKKKIN